MSGFMNHYRVSTVAHLCDASQRTVWRWIKLGMFGPHVTQARNGATFVSHEGIEYFLGRSITQPSPAQRPVKARSRGELKRKAEGASR